MPIPAPGLTAEVNSTAFTNLDWGGGLCRPSHKLLVLSRLRSLHRGGALRGQVHSLRCGGALHPWCGFIRLLLTLPNSSLRSTAHRYIKASIHMRGCCGWQEIRGFCWLGYILMSVPMAQTIFMYKVMAHSRLATMMLAVATYIFFLMSGSRWSIPYNHVWYLPPTSVHRHTDTHGGPQLPLPKTTRH